MGYQINNDNNNKDEAIKKMFKLMMEALMEGERNAFLGYEKYDYLNKQTQNSRNGYYKRDLLTTLGNITSLAVSRDRLGEFASEFIDTYKH
jgi:transposase-like protein